jgi:hypothetical protein
MGFQNQHFVEKFLDKFFFLLSSEKLSKNETILNTKLSKNNISTKFIWQLDVNKMLGFTQAMVFSNFYLNSEH